MATLYGAKVALKQWEIGGKDPPPPDYYTELTVLKTLHHDNLVPLIAAVGRKGIAWIAMEFLTGGSADKFLRLTHPEGGGVGLGQQPRSDISMRDRMQMAIDAAKGLLYLHDNNLIHRDVKSLNLLVDGDTLTVKVADFGEAASKDSGLKEMTGSVPWMAPEVTKQQVRFFFSLSGFFFFFFLLLVFFAGHFGRCCYSPVLRTVFPRRWV